ncbi:MAG: zinc ribbon domain-containing protein [Lachnospiraceae bacterium]|nr:zinc ribbon domain-containing protein [Lachnospiraceae bacterium]
MFCPNCGSEVQNGAGFCPNCGYSIGGGAPAGGASGGGNLSIEIMRRAFSVVLQKPFRLWGLSLLCALLSIIAYILGGPVVAIGFVISEVLTLGMEWIFLDGYRGEEVGSNQLFEPFHNFWKSFGVMGWRDLWILLWALIPIAGPVFAIIKSYSYMLTPFIFREGEYTPQDALKESMARTNGYKGKMFLTDLLIMLVIFIPALILSLLGLIPYVGIVFKIIYVLVMLVVAVFAPLYCGLVRAAWYDEITGAQG